MIYKDAMETNRKQKRKFTEKVVEEFYAFLLYTLFLTLFFWAFATYRHLIVEEYTFSYIEYGYIFVESMVIAKVIMIGNIIGLGHRFLNLPLIIPTFYKTVVFSLFAILFNAAEHFVLGYFNGKKMSQVYQTFLSKGLDEILASGLVLFFVFFLLFAFLETGRALGEKKLLKLFFFNRQDGST